MIQYQKYLQITLGYIVTWIVTYMWHVTSCTQPHVCHVTVSDMGCEQEAWLQHFIPISIPFSFWGCERILSCKSVNSELLLNETFFLHDPPQAASLHSWLMKDHLCRPVAAEAAGTLPSDNTTGQGVWPSEINCHTAWNNLTFTSYGLNGVAGNISIPRKSCDKNSEKYEHFKRFLQGGSEHSAAEFNQQHCVQNKMFVKCSLVKVIL